jgi:hydroxyacid-oxoacid transhydrogenase
MTGVDLMRDIEIPNSIGAVGYTKANIPALVVPCATKQQRLLATCSPPVGENKIAAIFARSMRNR